MIKNYQCEMCGTIYDDEDSCQHCEEFHIKPKNIEAVLFQAPTKALSQYMDCVLIRMEDDKVVKYVYAGEVDADAIDTFSPVPTSEDEKQ